MLKIGDFSRLAQVSIRALRLYDEIGLLKPARIDRFTDYRYYDPSQLPRLHRILALKDLGLTLDQIKALIDRDLPVEELEGMLLMKQHDLENSLRKEQARLRRVAARLRQLRVEGAATDYEVVMKGAPAQWIAGRRGIIPTLDDMPTLRCRLYADIDETFAGLGLKPGRPQFAIYHLDGYAEEDVDLEAAVGVDEPALRRLAGTGLLTRELPAAPMVASVIHHGQAMGIADAFRSVFHWMSAHELSLAGPPREIHLDFQETAHDFNQPVTVEIQVPVEASVHPTPRPSTTVPSLRRAAPGADSPRLRARGRRRPAGRRPDTPARRCLNR